MKTESQHAKFNSRANITRFQLGLGVGIFILCLASVAWAAGALRGRGRFTGHATLTRLANDQMEMQINVAGPVTHLGRSTVQIHSVADFSGPIPTPVPPTTGVITAANGDTVIFQLKWAVQESTPGVFLTFGPFEITGGTGRFRNATGSGNYRGRVDTHSGKVAAEISGELAR